MTPEIKQRLMGRPGPDATRMLIELTGVEATVEQISSAMQPILHELFRTVQPLPGAIRLVQHLHRHGIPIAIATGSRADNLEIKSSGLRELFDCFPSDRIVTADTLAELNLKGKPDPAIFELAARRLGRTTADARSRTLVFEDGVPGVQAALAAGCPCVWVPDQELLKHLPPQESTLQLVSLEDWRPEQFGLPAYD